MPDSIKMMPKNLPRTVPERARRKPFPVPRRRRPVVAVLIYPGVNSFDLSLATEMFGLTDMGPAWYRVVVCCERPGRLLSANNGLKLVADTSLRALAAADTIIVPGWLDTRATPPASLLNALRRAHRRGARLVSICSGVFVLAATGLLDGRRAAAHWAEADELARRYPAIHVDPNVLYVDEGDIMSSAGRAAGLDLCLHIVRRDFGAEVANLVAQRLVVPPHREGGQAQFIPRAVQKTERNALAPLFAWAHRHLDSDLTIARLASKAGMSRRTFIRRFHESTGVAPGEWVVQARTFRARELLEMTQLAIEDIATATGFGSADALRHHFRARLGTSPARYRTSFRRSAVAANVA
jgi:AraC family transcriptional regulator, transcriptional activator FtrA